MEELKAVIKALKESCDTQERDYSDQWREAGFKSALIVLLFQELLDYNPLVDTAFEHKLPSTNRDYLT
jgi:hypothetical protein